MYRLYYANNALNLIKNIKPSNLEKNFEINFGNILEKPISQVSHGWHCYVLSALYADLYGIFNFYNYLNNLILKDEIIRKFLYGKLDYFA